MANISVPKADNPYSVGIQAAPTQGMGIYDVPSTPYSPDKLYAKAGRAVDGLTKKVEAWQLEVDKTLAQDLINELHAEKLSQQNDPDKGWANQKGVNALNRESGKSLSEEAIDSFKNSYEQIRRKAGSPRVQKLFDQFYKNAEASLANEVNTHVNNQFQVYQNDVDQKTLENAISLGISDNPNDQRSGILASRAVIDRIYARKGLKPDYSKGPGLIHEMRLEALIDQKRILEAKSYLKENSSDLSAQQKAKAKRLLDAASKEAELDAQAKTFIDKLDPDNLAGNLQVLREAAKLPGEEGRKVEWRVQKEVSRMQRICDLEDKEREAAAWDFINKNPGQGLPTTIAEEIKSKDPEAWRRIERYQRFGLAEKTDYATYSYLERMAEGEPQSFAAIDLSTYKGIISAKDIEYLEGRQKKLGAEQYKQFIKMVEAACKANKIKTPEEIAEVKASANTLFDQQSLARKGGAFSHQDLEGLVNSLFKGKERIPLWWDSDRPFYKQITNPIKDWYGNDDGAAFERVNKDFPFVASQGFNESLLKRNKTANRAAEHYAFYGSFPPDLQAAAIKQIKAELQKKGIQAPITQQMINNTIAKTIFKDK